LGVVNLREAAMRRFMFSFFASLALFGCEATVRSPPPVAQPTGPVAIGWVPESARTPVVPREVLLSIAYRSDASHPYVELRMLDGVPLVESVQVQSPPIQIRRYRVAPGNAVRFRLVDTLAPRGGVTQLCAENFLTLEAAYGQERVYLMSGDTEVGCEFIVLTPRRTTMPPPTPTGTGMWGTRSGPPVDPLDQTLP
jgi:hypothetical protein